MFIFYVQNDDFVFFKTKKFDFVGIFIFFVGFIVIA